MEPDLPAFAVTWNLFDIPGINRTLTTMTFRAF